MFGPPGSIWVNQFFVWLSGANEITVYVMGCVFAIAGLLGVYRCATMLSDTRGGLVAAMAWLFLSSDLLTQANQPNTEVFINAFIVWGFALVFDEQHRAKSYRYILAGLLFFFATTVKHHMAAIPLFAAFAHVFFPQREGTRWRFQISRAKVRIWLTVFSTIGIAWLMLFSWFWATDRSNLLLSALFGDSLQYAGKSGGLLANFAIGLSRKGLMPRHQFAFLGLYLTLGMALAMGLFGSKKGLFQLLLGWTVGVWIAVAIPGKFFPHYYILWMPILAIGIGTLWAQVCSRLPSALNRVLLIGISAIFIGFASRGAYYGITVDADAAVLMKYPSEGPGFVEARSIGKMLATHDFKSFPVFEIGAYSFNFYTKRLPPSPYVDSLYGKTNNFPDAYRQAMLPKLIANPPIYLVIRRPLLEEKGDSGLGEFVYQLRQKVQYTERVDLGSPIFAVLELVRTPH
jgi:4-amino-4-deoxy-L-arabinose transferase-like glycosyltransferase